MSSQYRAQLSDLRMDYGRYTLDETMVPPDPYKLLDSWLNEAILEQIQDANAACLSTLKKDRSGPSSRIILLRKIDQEGLHFFTNYASRKGIELNHHSQATLLLFWPKLERQVCAEGQVVKSSESESDAYFASRPRDSQIGAWASMQSETVMSRAALEESFISYEKRFQGAEIPRPPHWGGYILKASRFEFWQGRKNRMHDRIVYQEKNATYTISRLFP